MSILIPGGEPAGFRCVGARVYIVKRGLGRCLGQAGQDQQSQWVWRWTVHESSLLQSGPWAWVVCTRFGNFHTNLAKALWGKVCRGISVHNEASPGGADDPGLGAIGASLRGNRR
ncbi:hypothetical protein D3C77_07720 [compost metagenome]